MEDPSAKLREKTMQIAQLNQRLEAMQAQLGGAQRRASQLTEQVQTLEAEITRKDSDIQALQADLSKAKGALDALGREVQGIKSKKTEDFSKKIASDDNPLKEELKKADLKVLRLKEDIKKLSEAATAVLMEQDGALEKLGDVIKDVGDIQHRIFNLVLERRNLKVDEIASILLVDTAEVRDVVDTLQTVGELEMKDSNTVIPAKKYREVAVPADSWKTMRPAEIFDSLEEIVDKAEGKDTIVEALEKAVDILEQKMTSGGTLIFQMRRAAGDWRRKEGSVDELKYQIRDWRTRAVSMQ
jgi:chromosome segregation ATPase